MDQKVQKSSRLVLNLAMAILLGVVVGLLYLSFEWIVNHGSNWLWNGVVQSDEYRWRVVPLALIMSIIFTLAVRILGQRRISKPSLSLLDELDDVKRTSLGAIMTIIIIGSLSLIAGASLGPEASLVAASMGIAAWMSAQSGSLHKPVAFILSVSSLGALLAAFFNSLLPVLIPLLLFKKKGVLTFPNVLLAVASGVTSWGMVEIIKGEAYVELPITGSFSISSFMIAGLIGVASTILALVLKWAIHLIFPHIDALNKNSHWLVSAIIFGTVIGLLYLIGGQTVQFSGSEGITLLLEDPTRYSVFALAGLVAVKLLATAWSMSTGYRGGLVFPSIYMGVTLSIAIITAFDLTGSNGVGAVIGSIVGILMGMTTPILGIVLSFALFPTSLSVVVLGGIFGALLGIKLTAKLLPKT